jgi:hypothetical protein
MEIGMEKYAVASFAAIISILLLVGVALAASDTAGTTASVSVNEFLSVTITSGAPVTFGGLADNTANSQATNGPLVATIGSETNVVNIDVRTSAANTDFCTDYPICAGDTFGVGNMEWSDASAGTYTPYTTSPVDVCTGKSAADPTCNVYHQISIPDNQIAGSYSTGITITVQNV